MRIIADENIPYVQESFSTIGEVRALPPSAITPEAVRDADVLVVRSVTRVNEALLAGSTVKFVGTATIGFDHVDRAYLASRGIGFSSAPGCNANSVAEYVMAALLLLHKRRKISLDRIRLGVVGVGNIGSIVVDKAHALGLPVVQNDPPRALEGGSHCFLPLDLLMDCDVITLHVPLSKEGPCATRHLFDRERIARMKKGAILINTARGAVVDGNALKEALRSRHLGGAILDVWENEPGIDRELLELVDIGTPHIAGLSLEGRVNGNTLIYRAVCKHFGLTPTWTPAVPAPEVKHLETFVDRDNLWQALDMTASAVYDMVGDDEQLRRLFDIPAENAGRYFAELRQSYRRREFMNTTVKIETPDRSLKQKFAAVGFRVE